MVVTTELRKTIVPQGAPAETRHAHVIVFGNEKGGTGKSTLAIHLAVAQQEYDGISARLAIVDMSTIG